MIKFLLRLKNNFSIRGFRYLAKKYWYLFFAIIYIVFCFAFSFRSSNFVEEKFFHFNNKEAESNIFSTFFTIMAGFVPILFTWFIYKNDEEKDNLNNFALLEPETIQSLILRDNLELNPKLLDFENLPNNLSSKTFPVAYKNIFFELSFVDAGVGFYRLVYDIYPSKKNRTKKENRCVFAIVNNGKVHSKAIKYWLLFKKRKEDDSREKYTISDRSCFISEPLGEYGYRFPLNHKKDIMLIYSGDLYEKFEKEKDLKEFLIVLEYKSVPTNTRIRQAYRADLRHYEFKHDEKGNKLEEKEYKQIRYVSDFTAILKDNLDEYLEKGEFLDELKKYSMI